MTLEKAWHLLISGSLYPFSGILWKFEFLRIHANCFFRAWSGHRLTAINIIWTSFKYSAAIDLSMNMTPNDYVELSPEFHGTFWTTFEQHLWFHGIPWNSMEFCPDPKFHGIPWNFFHTPEFHRIPWNSMALLIFPQKFHGIPWNFFWNSMEFHGTW